MKYLAFSLICLLLSACSSAPEKKPTVVAEYCDSYFIYTMCIKDLNADGKADLMYFNDSDEIFMVVPEFLNTPVAGLVPHPCVQIMDEGLRKTSTDVLAAQVESTVLERAQIKSKLILHYTRYLPKISRCHKPETNGSSQGESEEDDFGDEEFDDF